MRILLGFVNCFVKIAGSKKTSMPVTKKEETERLFALILTQHRRWGTILAPYIILRRRGVDYYEMAESLSPHPDGATLLQIDNEERETVRLINDYSDRNLFKLFSRHKNVKEFLENITDKEFEAHIKPYIETKIYNCLHLAANEDIPVFQQRTRITNLHPEDRLIFNSATAYPVFRFERKDEGSTYSLSVESEGNNVNLQNGNIEILSNSPCAIRKGNQMFFIRDIEGIKLKPFFSRTEISIPKNTELKYFSTFVLSVVNNHKVTGKGFRIIKGEPDRKAYLTVESGIRGIPVAILKFRYNDRDIFKPDELTHFTFFSSRDSDFVYTRIFRDMEWEESCVNAIEECGLCSEDEINFTLVNQNTENEPAMYDLIELVASASQTLMEAGITIRTGSLDKQYSLSSVHVIMNQEVFNDWFDLKAVVTIGDFKMPFTRLRRYILDGIREFPLPDGTVAILPEAWFMRYRGLFEMGKDEDESLMVHKQHFNILRDALSGSECSFSSKLEKLVMPDKLPVLAPPLGLMTLMRPYQAEGYNWLHFLQTNNLGGCLADDMGLGKTIQTLALLEWNKENKALLQTEPLTDNKEERQLDLFSTSSMKMVSLIVVPASLIHNWRNEIARFCPSMRVLSHQGPSRLKTTSHFSNYDIVLSSYHTVRQDIEFFCKFDFHYIVLDESQHIKNPVSHIYKAVIRLKSNYRLVLTGTPVENSLTDLWTQFNFVNPGLLGTLAFFRREFAKPIEKKKEDDRSLRLKKIIQPFIMRRTKEMVATELPPVFEQVVYCDMSEEQSRVYEQEKSAVRNRIMENIEAVGIEKSAIMVLQGLMKLRQIANHPVLTDPNYQSGSGKFETVTQNIKSVISEGHKILVFSSFVKHLELFSTYLAKNGIRYAMLTGSTRNREQVIDEFRNDQSVQVFLISLKAGGVGLNLTEADYVFILDPWWNPASEIQALSRAHRIGQEKTVFVYRYISGETIEEKIQMLQEKKSKLADDFVHNNNPLEGIDINKILEIIS
jgi:superfamily II DNA or RNA helicase